MQPARKRGADGTANGSTETGRRAEATRPSDAAATSALTDSAFSWKSVCWAEWGRLGGTETLKRYGTAWFSLLARRRWGRVDEDVPAEVFGVLARGGRGRHQPRPSTSAAWWRRREPWRF